MSGNSVELGSLLIRLGFNSNSVREGLTAINNMLNNTGNVAQHTGTQLHNAGAHGAKGFILLTRAAAGFTAVVTAGLLVRKFVQSVAASNSDLENFSKNIGGAANGISKMGNAAELGGGSADSIKALLEMLSVQQEIYKLTGDSPLLKFMNWLGIDFGKIVDPMERMLDIRKKLLDRTGGNKPQAYAMGLEMGMDKGALNLLLKPDDEFKALMAQASGTAMTASQSKAAEEITRSFTGLSQEFDSLNNVIMERLKPTILEFNDWLKTTVRWLKDKIGTDGVGKTFMDGALLTNPMTALPKILFDDFKAGAGGTGMWDFVGGMLDKIKNKNMFDGAFDDFFINFNNNLNNSSLLGTPVMPPLSSNYRPSPVNNYQSGGNKSVENNIGEIKIYTQTQDQAGEIANRLDYLMTSQANSAFA